MQGRTSGPRTGSLLIANHALHPIGMGGNTATGITSKYSAMLTRHASTPMRPLLGRLAMLGALVSPAVQERPSTPAIPRGLFAPEVLSAGDVDGDGRGDLIIRERLNGTSAALIVSAFDGRVIRGADEFGAAALNDVRYAGEGAAGPSGVTLRHDGQRDRLLLDLWSVRDGVRDMTYVATPHEPGLPGEVRTICGVCGVLLSTHPGAPAGTSLRVEDRNADGVPDILSVEDICLGNTPGPTSVVLRSGRTGEELSRIPVPGAARNFPLQFGPRFLPLGDIDGDGAAEIIVTFPTAMPMGDTALALLDGTSLQVLWSAPSEERGNPLTPYLGSSVALLGDVDGDCVPDVAVAGDNPWAALDGAVQVHSGRTGALISRITRASISR